jgi:type II secretory pathway component GspD/PulD (secretin)
MQALGTAPRSNSPGPVARFRRAAPAVLACALLFVGSCRSSQSGSPARSKEEISRDELAELISQGSLHPVGAMQGEDAFDQKVQEGPAGTDPFEGAARTLADPQGLARPAGGAPPTVGPPENPYLVFGKRIVVHPDGRITKPYPLRVGTGKKLETLLRSYGGFPLYDPASGPQGTDTVCIDLQEGWDIELYADLRADPANVKPAQQIPLADWLVVTAAPQLLHDVEDFINIFAAGVPQIEIEAKIVEVRTFDSLDLGVTERDGKPILDFPAGTAIDSFTFNFPIAGAGARLALGTVQDGTQIDAVLEALAHYENVSIISRPKIAVREGGRAEIVTVQRIPFFNVTGINASGQFGSTLTYEEVGVKLYVVPRVVGTETVALNIDVEASQETGTSVTFTIGSGENQSELSNPIISSRSARTTVYLEPGQAVILGGLITERLVDQVDKVPILGDIPLLGLLFRSKFKSKEQSNVLFFIRPRILEGTDLHREF